MKIFYHRDGYLVLKFRELEFAFFLRNFLLLTRAYTNNVKNASSPMMKLSDRNCLGMKI